MSEHEGKAICFAYYVNDKFVGWYSDTFGRCTPASPKVYNYSDDQLKIIAINFSNTMLCVEGIAKYTGIFSGIGEGFVSEFKGQKVDLRIIECPYYIGPNTNFDEDRHQKYVDEYFTTKRARLFYEPGNEKWVYPDYNKMREWASKTPTHWIEILEP